MTPAAGGGRRRCWPRAGSTVPARRARRRATPSVSWPPPPSRACSTPDAAVALAAVRGREMAAACALEPTGMSAVLGGNPEDVLATTRTARARPGQPQRRGADRRRRAAARAGAAGRAEAGARPAWCRWPSRARSTRGSWPPPRRRCAPTPPRSSPADPTRPLLSNADGSVVDSGAEALRRLVAQVTRPVRWDACMAMLGELGVTAVIELPPAGALVGLVKRELKGTAHAGAEDP